MPPNFMHKKGDFKLRFVFPTIPNHVQSFSALQKKKKNEGRDSLTIDIWN